MRTYLQLLCLLFLSVNVFGQDDGKPDYLFHTFSSGNNSTYSDVKIESKGVYKSTTIQATSTQSPAYWGFYDNSFDYVPKWVRTSSGSPLTVNQFNDDYAIAIYDPSGFNGEVNITAGKYYTINIQDVANANADMSILETDFMPQSIDAVTQVPSVDSVYVYQDVTVTITTGGALNAGELLWLRYTLDDWATSSFVSPILVSGNDTYEAVIPGQSDIEDLEYYVLTTLASNTNPMHSTIDYMTLELRPEIVGNNYKYTTKYPESHPSSPVIDGVFDGVGVWGNPVNSADGIAGWAAVNVTNLYATNDDYYYYFGAAVNANDWMHWGLVINTMSGGGNVEPSGYAITYEHSDLPDYVVTGSFGDPLDNGSNSPTAQLRTWNGTTWNSKDYTVFMDEDETQFVEFKVLKMDIGSPTSVDIQFYITGNVMGEHGTFDACPDDEVADSWNEGSDFNVLDNYQTNVVLPVELAAFSGQLSEAGIDLFWLTLSELNNRGFEIQKSVDGLEFESIGFVEGEGTTVERVEYSFLDRNPSVGANYYRLKQMDYDGIFEYSGVILVNYENQKSITFYPNPVNDNLIINGDITGNVSVRIMNLNGQFVSEYDLNVDNNFRVDVSGLNSGSYYLLIETEADILLKEIFIKE